MTQQQISMKAWLTIGALAMIWGASFLAFAIGLRELPVFTLVAHRVFWGALTLWLVVLLFRIDDKSFDEHRIDGNLIV